MVDEYDPEEHLKNIPGYERKYPRAWSVSMTPKEAAYFFFKRKRCLGPLCSAKLTRYSNKEYVGLQDFAGAGSTGGNVSRRTYEFEIRYKCCRCGRDYSLSELAIGEKISPASDRGKTREQVVAADRIAMENKPKPLNVKDIIFNMIMFAGLVVVIVLLRNLGII